MRFVQADTPYAFVSAVNNARTGDRIRSRGDFTCNLVRELVLREVHDVQIACDRPVTIAGHQFAIARCSLVTIENMRFSSAEGVPLLAMCAWLIRNKLGGVRSLLIIDSSDITIKHCSIRFGTDDLLDITGYENRRIRILRCLIYGGLVDSKAIRVAPRSGQDIVHDADYVTIDACAIVGCRYRTPKMFGGRSAVRRCVIVGQTGGSEFIEFRGDFVDTYFVPSRGLKQRPLVATEQNLIPGGIYLEGNYLNGVRLDDQWALLGWPGKEGGHHLRFRATAPHFPIPKALSATEILDAAGPTERDNGDELALFAAHTAMTGVTP